MRRICIEDDCSDFVVGRGLCRKHWQRWRKYGDTTLPPVKTVWERIEKKVQQEGDCWRWTAARDTTGYGRIVFERKLWPAHRLIYTLLVGEVPAGLVLDHLCRNRWCVNPYHLDPVTDAVNFSRAPDPNAAKRAQTHCKNGHPFEGRNLIMRSNGGRDCRACGLAAVRKYKQKAAVA